MSRPRGHTAAGIATNTPTRSTPSPLRPVHAVSLLQRPRLTLGALLILAFLIRLPLIVFTPGYDVRDYKVWARVTSEVGIGGVYSAAYPSGTPWLNYPPLHPFVLRATAWLYQQINPDGDWRGQDLAALLKLSPVLAELVAGVLIYRFLRPRAGESLALCGAAAFLLNPAVIWNTAYWGGIDAFHTLFLAAALFAAAGSHHIRAWPLAVFAVGAKLLAAPAALTLLPAALCPPSPGNPRARDRLGEITLATLAATVAALLLALPVILRGELDDMITAMFRNLGSQAVVSANAHNLWWLLTLGDGWRRDTLTLVAGLDYRTVGLILFGLIAAHVLTRFWPRAADPTALLSTAAFLAYALFFLTTEVHENWNIAMYAPLAVLAILHPPYRRLYLLLTLTTLANLAIEDPPIRRALGPTVDNPAMFLSLINAAAACALFLWWLRLLHYSPSSPTPTA